MSHEEFTRKKLSAWRDEKELHVLSTDSDSTGGGPGNTPNNSPSGDVSNSALTAAGGSFSLATPYTPKVRIPLVACFALQIIVVIAGFAGMCAMFISQNRAQLDRDVHAIVHAKLHAGRVALQQPLSEHEYRSEQLMHHVVSGGWEMHDTPPGASFNFSAQFSYFPTFRIPLIGTTSISWSYQLLQTNRLDGNGTAFTHESGCGEDCCYYCLDADCWYAIGSVRQGGIVSSDFSTKFSAGSAPLTEPTSQSTYAQIAMSSRAFYRYGHLWSSVYMFEDSPGGPLSLLASVFHCLHFDNTTDRCTNAVGADLNMNYLSEVTRRLMTPESSVTVVDLRSMYVLATSYGGQQYRSSNISDGSSVGHDDLTWITVDAAVPQLRDAVARYLDACPVQLFNETSASVPVSTACAAQVSHLANGDIVGFTRVLPFSCGQIDLLIIHITSRSYYYDEPERAAFVACAVVAVVSVICITVGLITYASIASPLKTIVENFKRAEELANETVKPCASIIAEVQALCCSFHGMNQCLLVARAFLPPYLVVSAQQAAAASSGGEVHANNGGKDRGEADNIPGLMPAKQLASSSGDSCAGPTAALVSSSGEFDDDNSNPLRIDGGVGEDTKQGGTGAGDCKGVVRQASEPSGAVGPSMTDNNALRATTVTFVPSQSEQQHRLAVRTRAPFWQRISSAGLSTRTVAVVFGNVAAFHSLCQTYGAGRSIHAAQFITTIIQKEVDAHNGVLEHFHGDRYMITFNASTPAINAPRSCKMFLCSVQQELRAATSINNESNDGVQLAGVRFGAAAGPAVCGHTGSRTMQRHATIGPVVNYAWQLTQHCKALGIFTLMDPRVSQDAMPTEEQDQHEDQGPPVVEAVDLVAFFRGEMLSIADVTKLHIPTRPPLTTIFTIRVENDEDPTGGGSSTTLRLNAAFAALAEGRDLVAMHIAGIRVEQGALVVSSPHLNSSRRHLLRVLQLFRGTQASSNASEQAGDDGRVSTQSVFGNFPSPTEQHPPSDLMSDVQRREHHEMGYVASQSTVHQTSQTLSDLQ